jgi:hypothetical protein
MAATVLNSPRAVAMSVYIVRAFVRLRTMLEGNVQLARKLDALEKSVAILDADTRGKFRELRAVVFSLASPPRRKQSERTAQASGFSKGCPTMRRGTRGQIYFRRSRNGSVPSWALVESG